MFDARKDLPARDSVGTELIGDHTTRPATLLVKKAFQQSLGGFGVAAKLDDFVENITILIDGPPEVASLTADRYDDFVQMPDVASTRLFSLQAAGIIGSEFHGPATNGFVGDRYPAFEQHFLHEPQAEWEAKIEPDGVGDDLRWEAMALVARGRWIHDAQNGPPRPTCRLT